MPLNVWLSYNDTCIHAQMQLICQTSTWPDNQDVSKLPFSLLDMLLSYMLRYGTIFFDLQTWICFHVLNSIKFNHYNWHKGIIGTIFPTWSLVSAGQWPRDVWQRYHGAPVVPGAHLRCDLLTAPRSARSLGVIQLRVESGPIKGRTLRVFSVWTHKTIQFLVTCRVNMGKLL